MKKAIVVGCDVGGYGVIRALMKKRVPTIALSYDTVRSGAALARVSWLGFERVRVPHPGRQEEDFVYYLLQRAKEWGRAVLVDTDDDATIAISRNKEALARHYRIVTADWPVLRQFIDKKEAWRLAQRVGVPHPRTFLLSTPDDLAALAFDGEISYPYILKPVIGHEFARTFGTKNFKVTNRGELAKQFERCFAVRQEVMLQEVIPGPDTNIKSFIVYIDAQGKMGPMFSYDKIRQDPPQFGVMRVGISKAVNPEMKALAHRLLRAAEYRGVCEVEFRRDPRDRVLKLMEVNARMPRMNWLATYCGVNYPWIIYQDLVHGVPVEIPAYTVGAYWIEMFADLKNSLLHRGREGYTLREYVLPYLKKRRTFGDMSVVDPLPFLTRLSVGGVRLVLGGRLRKKRERP